MMWWWQASRWSAFHLMEGRPFSCQGLPISSHCCYWCYSQAMYCFTPVATETVGAFEENTARFLWKLECTAPVTGEQWTVRFCFSDSVLLFSAAMQLAFYAHAWMAQAAVTVFLLCSKIVEFSLWQYHNWKDELYKYNVLWLNKI